MKGKYKAAIALVLVLVLLPLTLLLTLTHWVPTLAGTRAHEDRKSVV